MEVEKLMPDEITEPEPLTTNEIARVQVLEGEVMNRMIKLAKVVSQTTMVPRADQGKVDQVFAKIMFGAGLGLQPMESLWSIHMIEGKPTLSSAAMRTLVARAGHSITPVEMTDEKVTVVGKRKDGAELTVTWTVDDAKQAQLWGKDNWKKYPRQMLLARASAECARALFADVLGGLYTEEELS